MNKTQLLVLLKYIDSKVELSIVGTLSSGNTLARDRYKELEKEIAQIKNALLNMV